MQALQRQWVTTSKDAVPHAALARGHQFPLKGREIGRQRPNGFGSRRYGHTVPAAKAAPKFTEKNDRDHA